MIPDIYKTEGTNLHNDNLELINYNGIILLYKGRQMSIENLYVGQVNIPDYKLYIRQFGT